MNVASDATRNVGRRDFFKKALIAVISAVLGLVPLGAGVALLLDPLRRRAAAGGLGRVATLAALPADGGPHKFPVLATRVDAWNKSTPTPIGAVYLPRTAESTRQAFN